VRCTALDGLLGAATLEIRHLVQMPGHAGDVLGVDNRGQVVVGTTQGFILLDADTLAVVDEYR
jgi:hypothetical protein